MPNTIQKQEYDIQDQIDIYKKDMTSWFNKRYFKSEDVRAFSFDDDVWLLNKAYSNNDRERMDFEFCNKVIYNKYDKIIIKCFLVNMLMDGYSEATVANYFTVLKQFYVSTHGLSLINEMSDEEIKYNCSKNDQVYLYVPLNYIDFVIENYFYDTNYENLAKAKSILNSIHFTDNQSYENRELPSNNDIAMFQFYLHQFEANNPDDDVRNLFYPMIIWWKLTIRIPTRPSEITFNLNKNCVFIINNACYIRLNRIKGNLIKSLQIPIIKKICISQDLYDMIHDYQELVEYDIKSETLFSIDYLRKCFLRIREKDEILKNKANTFLRSYEEYTHFEASDLNQLIDLFYDYYIDRQIDAPKNYDRLRAGDTRHLAFSSLLLQNLNPIDIAMIGGHTTIASLGSYVNHIDLYIDSEVYRYYTKIDLNSNTYSRRLKDIIMKMSFQAPANIADAIPDEYRIGYCLDNSFSCEDDVCFFCSKWWCRPKNENYIKAAQIISNRIMKHVKSEMNANKVMLHTLLNKASVEIINGNIILKEEYYSQYRQLIKSVTSNASRMEMLKGALLLNFNLEDELNE